MMPGEELKVVKELPEVYICANDFITLMLLSNLRELGLRVPVQLISIAKRPGH